MKTGANPPRRNGRRAAGASARYPVYPCDETPVDPLHIAGHTIGAYAAFYASAPTVLIAAVGILVLDAADVARGRDETRTPGDEDEGGRRATSPAAPG
jgi:hypothetical protein